LLHTGGMMPDGGATKILWLVENRYTGSVFTLHGRNMTGTGQVHLQARGTGGMASIVNVPTPGCWRFQLKDGRAKGTVTMEVVAGS
jgi:hypothetical protein